MYRDVCRAIWLLGMRAECFDPSTVGSYAADSKLRGTSRRVRRVRDYARFVDAAPSSSRKPTRLISSLEVGVNERDGLVLVAGHEMAVEVECRLDRGVS
jgi:hypothetical protein